MSPQTRQTGPLSDWSVTVVIVWVADMAVAYLFYGANIVISSTVIYLLTTTSTRMTRGRIGLLFSTIFMLLVSTVFVALNTAYIFVQIPLFAINPPDIISSTDGINIVTAYADRLNFLACDGIAVWRAWILYPHNLVAKIVLILCMIGSLAGTFVNAGLVTEEYLRDIDGGPLEMLEQVLPLLITNLVSTSMIAYKAWCHKRDVRKNLISTNGSVMKIQKIMWFLVESGFFYCTFWISDTVVVLKGTSSSRFLQISPLVIPMLSAIYPLLVVLIAAHEQSKEAGNNVIDNEDAPRRTPSSAPNCSSSHGNGFSGHAGFAGSSNIAYDPKDREDEVLLLGIKDKQGYLSCWNDNISYALRGCILIELALRRRIALVRDPARQILPLSERLIEVIDDRQTGETILDEALKMMKSVQDLPSGGTGYASGGVEKMSVNKWIDLLSGETWNVLKIGFQLKQVRERLAKGLVDKGVLRTEKRNFLLFDMATHPAADYTTKSNLITRVTTLLTATTSTVPSAALDKEGTQCRVIRAVCLVCAAYTASVLDNAFGRMGYEEREGAFQRADEILGEFASWPFGSAGESVGFGPGSSSLSTPGRRKAGAGSRIATGSSGDGSRESILGLLQEVRKEMMPTTGGGTGGGAQGEGRCGFRVGSGGFGSAE
ncbi:GPP34-domain-containing protein [Dendrothele bispora CBS 962.96]|uniref:GPP34-domain-containing protein n=1 Tax=Dendrothele bispora (strain CBS 962.96) TaxID=1314807 RepID=A0A4S8KV13_DENBC|nr:GPP34-domain-containing protein [Dendrothele bispora CBS 962.96]